MLRGVRWLAISGVVLIAALIGPTVALASSCNDGSATSIYVECKANAKGGTHPTDGKKPVTHPSSSSTTSTTPSIQPVHNSTPPVRVHRPTQTIRNKHKHAANNRTPAHHVKALLASSDTKESSLGSAFDLGSGPMLLFALLAGTVLALLGTGGVRSWRNRHRV